MTLRFFSFFLVLLLNDLGLHLSGSAASSDTGETDASSVVDDREVQRDFWEAIDLSALRTDQDYPLNSKSKSWQ